MAAWLNVSPFGSFMLEKADGLSVNGFAGSFGWLSTVLADDSFCSDLSLSLRLSLLSFEAVFSSSAC